MSRLDEGVLLESRLDEFSHRRKRHGPGKLSEKEEVSRCLDTQHRGQFDLRLAFGELNAKKPPSRLGEPDARAVKL